jgi:CubicO group peptidase (beta-lactamase class C family)
VAGISAGIARRGKDVWRDRFGWLDREAGRPMTDDAIFMIFSMTKPVTGLAAMILYEEGAFDLNTPIARFAPAFRDTPVFAGEKDGGMILAPLDRDITYRDLFTHTSGMSYGWDDTPVDRAYRAVSERLERAGTPMTNARLIEEMAKLPLRWQPGTQWGYGMSTDVIGALIEIISGNTLADFMAERIFRPLGMADTAFHLPTEKEPRRAVAYGAIAPDVGFRRLEEFRPPPAPPHFLSGGGGLVSTLEDYTRFAQMLANGGALDGVRILGPSTTALFSLNLMAPGLKLVGADARDPRHEGYGFSLATRVLVDVSASGCAGNAGEFGWDGMLNTYFWVDPREALTGVLMLQRSPSGLVALHREFKQTVYQALVA